MGTWYHYVGGFYNPQSFLREALKYGVARRVPPAQARAMRYGDRVVLLHWDGGKPKAFAAFEITRLVIEGEVGQEVLSQLKARLVDAGGRVVVRECGSYISGPTWVVEEDIPDIMAQAERIAKERGLPLMVMVGGRIVEVYKPPRPLPASFPFFRGFKRVSESTEPARDDGELEVVANYKKRRNKKRRDLQYALPGIM
jgi:hypothetical protein